MLLGYRTWILPYDGNLGFESASHGELRLFMYLGQLQQLKKSDVLRSD